MDQTSLAPDRVLMKKILLSAIPGIPPPILEMISSAKRCAISLALSTVAPSRYCLPRTGGEAGFFTSTSQPWTPTLPASTARLPNASSPALGGGLLQAAALSSPGAAGFERG